MEWRKCYLDVILVPLWFMICMGYHIWLWHKVKTQPFQTIIGTNANGRHLWVSAIIKETSKTNIENRKKLKNPHTAGFATIREKKKKETSEAPSSKDMFVATRSRKPGRVYKESYKDTMHKIAEIEQIQNQESEDNNQSIDAFTTVMGPEHPGRVRLYGRGVTKTILKQKSGNFGTSSKTIDEIMEQKMEEMEEKMQERMQKKFEEQQETWWQQITRNVVAQLQHLKPDLRIDPSMLALGDPSLGEASSAQQAGIQLINLPSTGSTNQDQHLLGNATSPTCHVQTFEEDNRPPTSNALQTVLVATHKQKQRK
ncbi:uncharacterized protein [Nicotiana sylvestris]|uniref:Uncharacterized protein LOC104239866 isoform X1 n=2 Tax=Nicotiana sylvestris TaxID=4096 RepID=A0A1U7XPT2_NICSY|nr:PREDICTED: uncharacterized protein LOC104239866 isoform X1 [Nicotiana sylvestris]XP_009792894.1 PREDICTED: uncharacterized protein LOC104239866 isoform X1 [Nicotiana sylvestris]